MNTKTFISNIQGLELIFIPKQNSILCAESCSMKTHLNIKFETDYKIENRRA